MRTIKVSDRKGELITARIVRAGQNLLLVSKNGQVIRIEVDSVKRMGRSTEGVRLMDVGDEDQVVTCAPVDESEGPVDEVDGDEAVASEDGPDGTDAPDEADDASAEDVEE